MPTRTRTQRSPQVARQQTQVQRKAKPMEMSCQPQDGSDIALSSESTNRAYPRKEERKGSRMIQASHDTTKPVSKAAQSCGLPNDAAAKEEMLGRGDRRAMSRGQPTTPVSLLQGKLFRKFRDQIMGVVPTQDPEPSKVKPSDKVKPHGKSATTARKMPR